MKGRVLVAMVLAAALALVIGASSAQALPNQFWVGSAVSGAWQTGSRIPDGDLVVEIVVRPNVLNLNNQGVYTVFATFPEEYEYPEGLSDIGGETAILKFKTQELDLKDVEEVEPGTEVIFALQETLGEKGPSFQGSVEGMVYGPGTSSRPNPNGGFWWMFLLRDDDPRHDVPK